ncbi:TetR/AcrR family transcriptional regulator [Novosphingobium sp. BL-8A]|uniref:TetR/AcrR family transcriptional regulator n=1 Tax=Novosphingobium sp. BL-8A TaxID=3127639 RepID=UPI0037571925
MDKGRSIGDARFMTEASLTINIEDDLARVGVMPAQQSRSRTLRDRLIQESLEIARKVPFDDVSIIDICAAAQCSTGAFYSRFPDKITLFKAVMVFAAAESGPLLENIVRDEAFEDILPKLVSAQVDRYLSQQTFFRSAFKVSLDSEQAWEPFRRNSQNLASAYIDRVLAAPEIDQTGVNEERIRFAFQIMYGVLNNTLSNRPGPFFLESREFSQLLKESLVATMNLPIRGSGAGSSAP